MKNANKTRIKKRTAYAFFSWTEKEVVITNELLEGVGVKCDARYLSNLTEKQQEEIWSDCFDADTERYDFYYPVGDGRYVNVYEASQLENGEWDCSEDAGKEFKKFYNLVRV